MCFAIFLHRKLIAVSDDEKTVDKFIENQPESPDEFNILQIRKKDYKKYLDIELVTIGECILPRSFVHVYTDMVSGNICTDSFYLTMGITKLMKDSDLNKYERKILKKAIDVLDSLSMDGIRHVQQSCSSYSYLEEMKELNDMYRYLVYDDF